MAVGGRPPGGKTKTNPSVSDSQALSRLRQLAATAAPALRPMYARALAAAESGRADLAGKEPPAGGPLVNSHTSPQGRTPGGMWTKPKVEIFAHSVKLEPCQIRRLRPKEQIGGGKRGKVKDFSFQARNRLIRTVAAIETDQYKHLAFASLTYHHNWKDRDIKRDLDSYLKRVRRKYGEVAYIWRMEPQKRGAPHFHILLFIQDLRGDSDADYLEQAWHTIVDPDNDLHKRHGSKVIIFKDGYEGVRIYASKYCAKVQEADGENCPGRWWGKSRNLLTRAKTVLRLEPQDNEQLRRLARHWLERHATPTAARYSKVIGAGVTTHLLVKEAELDLLKKLKAYAMHLIEKRGPDARTNRPHPS